jgi:ribosomal protein S18 acetylase RimI-like enzyme
MATASEAGGSAAGFADVERGGESAKVAPDRWLSDLLGRPAWKVDADAVDLARVLRMIGPAFYYTRIAADDICAVHRFEDFGFRVVDLTITLEASARQQQAANVLGARFASEADRRAVATIAASSFAWSRLHLDPKIPNSVADRSRVEWATNFFAGKRGDAMVVAEDGGKVAAFMLLAGPAAGTLTIDLIAVRQASRRLGLGAACVRFAAGQVAGAERLRVGTQAANVGSLRFYESLGFQVVASHYVLHLHRD